MNLSDYKYKKLISILLCVLLFLCAHLVKAGDEAYGNIIKSYQYDQSIPLSVQVKKYKRYTDCFMLRITYSSTNNQKVPAILFEPFRASMWHPLPAIILLHDLGSSKEKLAKLGHFFAATGYSCLIIDEYGHGERAERGLNGAPQQGSMSIQGVQQTIIDVRRALDYMDTRLHVSPKRIGIIGFSLGAVIGADVAGIDDRVKAVVLISGGSNGASILKTLAKRQHIVRQAAQLNTPVTEPIQDNENKEDLSREIEPLTFAEHIAPRAVLMINGREDNVIPKKYVDELFDALEQSDDSNARIVWFDSGHKLPLDRIYPPLRKWLFANL